MNSFLYLHCLDLTAMRSFYGDALGLEEIYFSDVERTVGYRVGSLQLAVREDSDAERATGWAKQLGWAGGDGTQPSLGFELPTDIFGQVVVSLLASRSPSRNALPEWVGYWSFPVQDPMGNTVEISTSDRDAWT